MASTTHEVSVLSGEAREGSLKVICVFLTFDSPVLKQSLKRES